MRSAASWGTLYNIYISSRIKRIWCILVAIKFNHNNSVYNFALLYTASANDVLKYGIICNLLKFSISRMKKCEKISDETYERLGVEMARMEVAAGERERKRRVVRVSRCARTRTRCWRWRMGKSVDDGEE